VGESPGPKTKKDCAGEDKQQFTQTDSEEIYNDRTGDEVFQAKWLIVNNCEFLQTVVDKRNQCEINPLII
jgi:hypothetical protein